MRRFLGPGIVATGLVVLIVALLAAGGAPKASPAGLSGASMPVSWALPVLRFVADLAAIAVVGALLAVVVLLPSDTGKLAEQGLRAVQDAAVAAGVWALASLGGLVATASVILGVPLAHLGEHAELAGALNQVRALAVAIVLTAILAVVLSGCRTVLTARICLVIAVVALAGPLLSGHASAERPLFWGVVATASLVVHVLAATVWIGGLGALLRYARNRDAVERFSVLALVCAVSVGLTGLLTGEIHLGGREGGWGLITQWVTSDYGVLVFAKAIAFTALVCIGWWHRKTTLPALAAEQPAAFWRLAAGEILVMAGTVGLAVALSRTP